MTSFRTRGAIPASITRRGLKVLDASGNEVDPASIDWSKFKSGNIPYTLRQDPGPKNALGRVKIMFPNSYSVYLHDTPSQSKFEEIDRAFSSGCVRVERPLELAELLLANPASLERRHDRERDRRGPHAERDAAGQGAGAARLLDRVGGSAGTRELPPRRLRAGRAVGRRRSRGHTRRARCLN